MQEEVDDVMDHLRFAAEQLEAAVNATLNATHNATSEPVHKNETRVGNKTAQVAHLRGNQSKNSTQQNVSEKPKSQSTKEKLATEAKVLAKLFEHLKSNIGDFNKHENKGKEDSQKMIDKLQARLNHDRQQLKNGPVQGFDRELLVNR